MNELKHYGVKGMKWGKIHERAESAEKKQSLRSKVLALKLKEYLESHPDIRESEGRKKVVTGTASPNSLKKEEKPVTSEWFDPVGNNARVEGLGKWNERPSKKQVDEAKVKALLDRISENVKKFNNKKRNNEKNSKSGKDAMRDMMNEERKRDMRSRLIENGHPGFVGYYFNKRKRGR